MIPGIVAQRPAGGASYTGPLDEVPGALLAFDVNFAPAAADIGTKAFFIDSSDDTLEAQYGVDGQVSAAEIIAFLGGDTGSTYEFTNGGSAVTVLNPTGAATWDADGGGGIPSIDLSISALTSGSNFGVSSGAKNIVIVGSAISGGTILSWEDATAPGEAYFDFACHFNVPGDFYVDMSPAGSTDLTVWTTPAGLTAGRHIFQITIDALGNVAIKMDGVNMNAVKEFGDLVPPPAITEAVLKIGLSQALELWDAVYVWQGAGSVDAAIAIIADNYGITLP